MGVHNRPYQALLLLALLGATGCVHAPLNRPIMEGRENTSYRFAPRERPDRRDDLVVLAFFSGGGMRAAAFSYGVLQGLHETLVPVGAERRSLLSQVDALSAVSGGAFTAAYYCVNGESTFDTYEKRFLWRDIQSALFWRCIRPDNAIRLLSPYFGRSDLAAEYYDRHLFSRATYATLAQQRSRPYLVINATDLENGARFGFTRTYFDLIGSDLGSYPVARAVAASSAVPFLLSPVTLRNYAAGGQSGPVEPDSSPDILTERFRRVLGDLAFYRDAHRPIYLHVVDGGVTDNLGLRAAEDFTLLHGGLRRTFAQLGMDRVTKLAVIVVDASTQTDTKSGATEAVPGIFRVMSDAGTILLGHSNFETGQLFDQSLRIWQTQMGRSDRPLQIYRIWVHFSNVGTPRLVAFCNNVSTGLRLPVSTAITLRDAGRAALENNSEYRRLEKDLE
jgi:NTE family protein